MNKKKLLTTTLALLCLTSLQAQDLLHRDKFFDGTNLFTIVEMRNDIVYYLTSDDEQEITLERVGTKPYEYTYQPSVQADEPIHFDLHFGDPVKVKQIGGQTYLIFYNKKGEALHVYRKTTDGLYNCQQAQQHMTDQPYESLLTQQVLNRPYLQNITRENLRLMRNEILARHGYNFQSKDLKDYFSQKSWYKPAKSNSGIKLNIIEETNVQLIKSIEAIKASIK